MAIATLNTNEPLTTVSTLAPEEDNFKTVVDYNDLTPLDTVLQYISGYKWTVDYFLQLKEEDDYTSNPDYSDPKNMVNYARIKDLILYVENPIEQTGDINEIEGSAVINAGFVPLVGDAFLAVLTGNINVIFYITNVSRFSYNKKPVYKIDYKVYSRLDVEPIILDNLKLKTAKEYVFNKDHILDNTNPILISKDYEDIRDFKKEIDRLTDFYFTKVVNNKERLILIPNSTFTINDLFLENFIFKVFDSNSNPYISRITRLNINDKCFKEKTILDNILYKDNNFNYITKTMELLSTDYLSKYPLFRTLIFNGIYYTLKPKDCIETIINESYSPDNITLITNDEKNYFKDNRVISEFEVIDNELSYIFSLGFYNNDPQSLFEEVLLDFLNNRVLDKSELNEIIDDILNWNEIQKIYYIPILIVLLKDAIRNSYTVL